MIGFMRQFWTQLQIALDPNYTVEGLQRRKTRFRIPGDLRYRAPHIKRQFTICNLFINHYQSIRDIAQVLDVSVGQVVATLINHRLLKERRHRFKRVRVDRRSKKDFMPEEVAVKRSSVASEPPASSQKIQPDRATVLAPPSREPHWQSKGAAMTEATKIPSTREPDRDFSYGWAAEKKAEMERLNPDQQKASAPVTPREVEPPSAEDLDNQAPGVINSKDAAAGLQDPGEAWQGAAAGLGLKGSIGVSPPLQPQYREKQKEAAGPFVEADTAKRDGEPVKLGAAAAGTVSDKIPQAPQPVPATNRSASGPSAVVRSFPLQPPMGTLPSDRELTGGSAAGEVVAESDSTSSYSNSMSEQPEEEDPAARLLQELRTLLAASLAADESIQGESESKGDTDSTPGAASASSKAVDFSKESQEDAPQSFEGVDRHKIAGRPK